MRNRRGGRKVVPLSSDDGEQHNKSPARARSLSLRSKIGTTISGIVGGGKSFELGEPIEVLVKVLPPWWDDAFPVEAQRQRGDMAKAIRERPMGESKAHVAAEGRRASQRLRLAVGRKHRRWADRGWHLIPDENGNRRLDPKFHKRPVADAASWPRPSLSSLIPPHASPPPHLKVVLAVCRALASPCSTSRNLAPPRPLQPLQRHADCGEDAHQNERG